MHRYFHVHVHHVHFIGNKSFLPPDALAFMSHLAFYLGSREEEERRHTR